MPSFVYLLRLCSGRIYVGLTDELDKRIRDHNRGKGGRTTRSGGPAELLYYETFDARQEAAARERQLKKWSAQKKLALARAELGRLKLLARNRSLYPQCG